jgi:hypothetical protein
MLTELIGVLTTILTQAPQFVTEIESIWSLVTATTQPTDAEQAAIDAALEKAHKDLQAS